MSKKEIMAWLSLIAWSVLLTILISKAIMIASFDVLSFGIGTVWSLIIFIIITLVTKRFAKKSEEFKFTLVLDDTMVIIFEGTLNEFSERYKVPRDEYNDVEYFNLIEEFAMENGLRVVARQYGLK